MAALDVPARGKARRTYESLVEASWAEIASSGSFSAERVAARAGASPATFYAYFSCKDDALAAAFGRALDRMVEVVEAGLQIERLLEHGLGVLCRDFVASAAGFFSDQSRVFRCALARLPESRALREVYREHEIAVFLRYRRFLELGQAAGKLRGDDPETLAHAMLVLTEGLNNPLALDLEAGDPLLTELGETLRRLLEPRASRSG
jgi:AcrR family transcriptional regulator